MQSGLIDRIYQAAVVLDTWPETLQEIADTVGAKGALFMVRSPEHVDGVVSPALQQDFADYFAAGWGASSHAADLLAEMPPAFRTETDYHTAEEIARMPVHAEFMDPRGLIAGVGTAIQGAADSIIQVTLEGFPSHEAARRALPLLDRLRPDLARAVSLTALHRQRSDVVVSGLALVGVAAALVGPDGRLRAANDLFVARMGNRMLEIGGRLRFTDRFLGDRLAAALARHSVRHDGVHSVAVRCAENDAFAIHLVPVTGKARDYCGDDGILLIIAESANASVPDADLLRVMFDLTPAEARLARGLMSGSTLEETARQLGISKLTARTQLRGIFAKTGVSRQVDLVLLLASFRPPPAG